MSNKPAATVSVVVAIALMLFVPLLHPGTGVMAGIALLALLGVGAYQFVHRNRSGN